MARDHRTGSGQAGREPDGAALPSIRVMIALGRVAHDAALRVLNLAPSRHRFAHGAEHKLPDGRVLIDSYHCSRYNQNTGRLTVAMFEGVFGRVVSFDQAFRLEAGNH